MSSECAARAGASWEVRWCAGTPDSAGHAQTGIDEHVFYLRGLRLQNEEVNHRLAVVDVAGKDSEATAMESLVCTT